MRLYVVSGRFKWAHGARGTWERMVHTQLSSLQIEIEEKDVRILKAAEKERTHGRN